MVYWVFVVFTAKAPIPAFAQLPVKLGVIEPAAWVRYSVPIYAPGLRPLVNPVPGVGLAEPLLTTAPAHTKEFGEVVEKEGALIGEVFEPLELIECPSRATPNAPEGGEYSSTVGHT